MRVVVHCLHGFLGQASDWEGILPEGIDQERYDLFSNDSSCRTSSQNGLVEWGQWINSEAQRRRGAADEQTSHVLLGYSLGGRIALHALTELPHFWSAAIIVSAHPGLASTLDRESRLKADQAWAMRFRTENWDKLIHDWNAQPVLKVGGSPLPRNEAGFSREKLADVMERCSLGNQQDLRSALKSLSLPILWISGEHDAKFRAIAAEMIDVNSHVRAQVVAGAGHRVPWDQPEVFRKTVTQYLVNLSGF